MTEVMGSSDTESLVRINNNTGEPGLESRGDQVRVWRVRVRSELISFLQQQKVSLDCDPLRGVGVISPECLKCLSVTQKTRPPYL